jgi:hypothetical protein
VRLRGTVERITSIDVSDNPYARSLGLAKYYQLDVFISLGDRRIELVDQSASPPMKFDYDYPATIVVAELPPSLQSSNVAGTIVEMPVVFFRMWSYPSIMSQRANPDRQQIVPLFVGTSVVVPAIDTRPFSTSVGIVVVAGVLGVALLLLWVWISERREGKRRTRALPDSIDIKE